MVKHVIVACILLCFFSTTYSPGAFHVRAYKLSDGVSRTNIVHQLVKRSVNETPNSATTVHDEEHLKKIFAMYGDGENINMEGFERLMGNLLRIVSLGARNKSEENSNEWMVSAKLCSLS